MPNPALFIDGYKLDHRRQYPEGTEFVYSNWTARSSRIEDQKHVVFLGLQHFLQKYLIDDFQRNFFERNIDEVCEEYERRVNGYLGPNTVGTDHIRALHALGYIPLEFSALPEGSLVPLRVPMFVVENTHPDFGWVTNYFETVLSCEIWLPCTSATLAYRMRDLLDRAAVATGSPRDFVQWQGHDFSMRGMSGVEAASLSGLGHLLSFTGTDTIPAIELAEVFYGRGLDEGYLIGGSIPATEHSVMCAGGAGNEAETVGHILDLYQAGPVSIVADTWNFWEFVGEIIPKYKDAIMARDGKVVIRPDSGDPVLIICGDPAEPVGSPAHKGAIQILWETFGGTITETGHKLLDSHIGCIYGDSITYERADAILTNLYRKGFASGNMVFGVGSYTYQYVTRDTFGFAMKATNVVINDESLAIFKDPITDGGSKKSAKGRLAVLLTEHGHYTLVNEATPEQEEMSELKPVWRDGKFITTWNIAEMRENLHGTSQN